MTDLPNRLSDDLITELLLSRTADPETTLLDDILRDAAATPQHRRWLGRPLVPSFAVLLFTVALLAALVVSIAIGTRLVSPEPAPFDPLPHIRDVVGAINGRDADTLRSLLAADATVVLPHIQSDGADEAPMSEGSLDTDQFLEVWLATADAWGLEAEISSCGLENAVVIACEVTARWRTLELEGVEVWTFEFNGSQLTRIQTVRLDREPVPRTLPLGHPDLASWEAWLADVHPAVAQDLAGDRLFWNYYFRYHLSEAQMIEPLIDEFLRSR